MKVMLAEALDAPLVLRDLPVPEPGPGEVRIRVLGTSVNFADVMMRRGGYHSPRPLPFIPGMDAYGVVDAVGPGVDGPTPGVNVVAFPAGAYAEYALVDRRLLASAPESASRNDLQGIGLVGTTAYELLTRAGALLPGETVLVHAAAGGVGSLLVQMAAMLGAGLVIGQVGHPEKAPLVTELGATRVLTGPPETWAEAVDQWTGGRGADLILNALQGDSLAADLGLLADFGRLVVYGQASGKSANAPANQLYPRNQRVIGYSFGHIRRTRPEYVVDSLATVLAWLRDGRIRVPVGGRFPLAEADAAQDLLAGGTSVGKVLIDVVSNS